MRIENWRDRQENLSLAERADYLWHIRESHRLVALALSAPHLLTYEEQEIWTLICEQAYFWRGDWKREGDVKKWRWICKEESIIRERVHEYWETIIAVLNGEVTEDELPKIPDQPLDEIEAEIPF